MRKKIYFHYGCFFSLLLLNVSVQTFDVKVLLSKSMVSDLEKKSLDLFSQHGFVISSHPILALGYQYPGKILTISASGEYITLNLKSFKEKLVYVSPMIAPVQLAELKTYISCWIEKLDFDVDQESKNLHQLFDGIVADGKSAESLEYDLLQRYVSRIFQFFLQDFTNLIEEDPSITFETLQIYADDFLSNKVKFLFLESLAAHNFTKEERKKLGKDKHCRHAFFLEHVHSITQKLLLEFVPALPAKFLQQFLKKDIATIEFQSNNYLGSFLLFQDKKQLYLINSLDIDDYLLSVIKHEGWPGWPLEMNKVLAIACRTYLVWQVLQAQKINRPYHIENGIKHQTYKGHDRNNCSKLVQAVQETRDVFVSYDDKPALTMYDVCCGGIVPANIDDPGHKRVSYLARGYPCTFCKNFKVFTWHVDLTAETILKRLQKDFSKVLKIVDIVVQKKDKAGLVKKILINVGTKKIVITDKKMKSLFPEIKSSCFNIIKAHRHYLIDGKGFGHHRGLCQWGACKLVKDDHWNFSQVLQFYYPGTKLMKLTYQR